MRYSRGEWRGLDNKDLISRQAAIDAFDCTDELIVSGEANAQNVAGYINKFIGKIEALPSAQPEIIRCKDCARREMCRTTSVWAVAPSDDWYCADGERQRG